MNHLAQTDIPIMRFEWDQSSIVMKGQFTEIYFPVDIIEINTKMRESL